GERGGAAEAGAADGEDRLSLAPRQQLLRVRAQARGDVGVDGRQDVGESVELVWPAARRRRLVHEQGPRGGQRLVAEDARERADVEGGVVAPAAGRGDRRQALEVGLGADRDRRRRDAVGQRRGGHALEVRRLLLRAERAAAV